MSMSHSLVRGIQKAVSSGKKRRGTSDTDAEIGEQPEEDSELEDSAQHNSEIDRNEVNPGTARFPLPPPPCSTIPQNILAFRFITAALAIIEQQTPFQAIDNLSSESKHAAEWASGERREVRICDALAHLAAAEYNVVAISTNWNQIYGTHHSTLGIMATGAPSLNTSRYDLEDLDWTQGLDHTHIRNSDKQPNEGDTSAGVWKWKNLKGIFGGLKVPSKWKITFTDNAQTDKHILNKRNSKGKGIKDENIPPDLFPSLESISNVPDNIEDKYKGDFDAYMSNLLEHWYLPYFIILLKNTLTLTLPYANLRQEPNLTRHLWILGKLITPPPKEKTTPQLVKAQRKRLYKYSLAICCKKIDIRFKSQRSQSYYSALLQVLVDNPKFPFTLTRSQPANKLHDPLELQAQIDVGIRNDYDFLTVLVFLVDKSPTEPGSPPLFPVEFPNILWKARNMMSTEKPYSFYDETTCIEFHLLLLELLARFKDAVQSLSESRKLDLSTESQAAEAAKFKTNVDNGRLYGYLLMRLARGRAFRQHVQNIEHLLAKHIAAVSAVQSAGIDEEAQEMTPDVEEEINDEIVAVEGIPLEQLGVLSNAFGSWLRLMVAPLDAAEIIVDFVNDSRFPFRKVSINLLIPPKTNSETLPWRKLFTGHNLFPKSDPLAIHGPTNAQIEDFLELKIQEATFATESHSMSVRAQNSWGSNNSNKVEQTLRILGLLESLVCSNDRLKDRMEVTELIKTIKASQANNQKQMSMEWEKFNKNLKLHNLSPKSSKQKTPTSQITSQDGIKASIASLAATVYPEPPAGSSFFMDFAKEKSFGGTLHCEAFMATLLDNATHPGTYDAGWNLHEEEMKVNYIQVASCFCRRTCY